LYLPLSLSLHFLCLFLFLRTFCLPSISIFTVSISRFLFLCSFYLPLSLSLHFIPLFLCLRTFCLPSI
jgi:hypothetical protein